MGVEVFVAMEINDSYEGEEKVIGVYSTKKKAVKACKQAKKHLRAINHPLKGYTYAVQQSKIDDEIFTYGWEPVEVR